MSIYPLRKDGLHALSKALGLDCTDFERVEGREFWRQFLIRANRVGFETLKETFHYTKVARLVDMSIGRSKTWFDVTHALDIKRYLKIRNVMVVVFRESNLVASNSFSLLVDFIRTLTTGSISQKGDYIHNSHFTFASFDIAEPDEDSYYNRVMSTASKVKFVPNDETYREGDFTMDEIHSSDNIYIVQENDMPKRHITIRINSSDPNEVEVHKMQHRGRYIRR